jgi:hypothetical protein
MRRPTTNLGRVGRRLIPGRLSVLACLVGLAPAALGAAVAGAIAPVDSAANCAGQAATIIGSAAADNLKGTAGADVIAGRGGEDRIAGGGGADLICAGGGADMVRAGQGNDVVHGGDGGDQLFGGPGDDRLVGGSGGDRCRGGGGADVLESCERVAGSDRRSAAAPTPPSDRPPASNPASPVIADAAPIAVDDQAAFSEDEEARAIDVGANDSDADGGPRSIAAISQPAHGSVSPAGGLAVAYQPNPGYCNDEEAPDTFTYTLNGGSTATVTVTVACLTRIVSEPGLKPAFNPAVSDYTVACDGSPLTVSGRTAAGALVSVDDDAATSGKFESEVVLAAEQSFGFSVDEGGQARDYHVRCLPPDFPIWEYERLRQPSHAFYVVSPTLFTGAKPYMVIFDDNGVPVWWHSDAPAAPSDAKVLANGNVVWWGAPVGGDAYEIRDLDGNLLNSVRPTTGRVDSHEFQVSPAGNYLITSYQAREHVDLTPFGGGADATVTDAVIEEVTPSGELEWIWNTHGHIGLEETGRWWPGALNGPAADIVHMNAVEPDGEDAVLISLRHTDAVYKIDKASGNVVWKLGGTWTPKSLAVKGDPEGAYPLGGQHDVRLQPDGTITIHDNRTNLPGSPRGVRYSIDEGARTATMVEQVTDPAVSSSFCCGSSRRSADGSWLFSWGGRSLVTEFDAVGQRTFRLGFGGTAFSYRAVPAPEGALTAAALRAGMDSMHPRP